MSRILSTLTASAGGAPTLGRTLGPDFMEIASVPGLALLAADMTCILLVDDGQGQCTSARIRNPVARRANSGRAFTRQPRQAIARRASGAGTAPARASRARLLR